MVCFFGSVISIAWYMGSVGDEVTVLFYDTPVGGDGHHLPGDKFPAVDEGFLHGVFNAAAAGHPFYSAS